MATRWIGIALLTSLAIAALGGELRSAQITGTVEAIAGKAQTIQILDSASQNSTVITIGKETEFVNAQSLRDFALNDVVTVDMEPGRPAIRVTRAVVSVSADQILSAEQLQELLDQPGAFTLVDARPKAAFDEGHLPGAISIYVEDLTRSWDQLPADKTRQVVFYCSGSS